MNNQKKEYYKLKITLIINRMIVMNMNNNKV